MKRYGLILLIGFVIFVNSIVFAGILYNRSGEPDAVVTMTEREATLVRARKENTGLFLRLNWEMSGAYQFHKHIDQKNWFDENKIKELGLDKLYFQKDWSDLKYSDYYRKVPPIKVFIVLEYDGLSWKNWLQDNNNDIKRITEKLNNETDQNKIKSLQRTLKQRKKLHLAKSRLFAIDAGLNPKALRNKYSNKNRYIIIPGIIKANYRYSTKGNRNNKSNVNVRIIRLFPEKIFVPNNHRSYLKTIKFPRNYSYYYVPENKTDSELLPQYETTLNFGKKYEAWITNVKPLSPTL